MGVVIRTVRYVCIKSACLAETCGTQCRMMLSVRDMLCERKCTPCAGAQLTSTAALHRGPVTAAAALPEAQGPLALTGGQDATILLSSVAALAAEPDDAGAAEAQPLVAYR